MMAYMKNITVHFFSIFGFKLPVLRERRQRGIWGAALGKCYNSCDMLAKTLNIYQ